MVTDAGEAGAQRDAQQAGTIEVKSIAADADNAIWNYYVVQLWVASK